MTIDFAPLLRRVSARRSSYLGSLFLFQHLRVAELATRIGEIPGLSLHSFSFRLNPRLLSIYGVEFVSSMHLSLNNSTGPALG